MLKAEQARLGNDIRSAQEGLATVDANLADWQEILETAMRFPTNCAKAYARASSQTRRRFNQAVFKRIEVRDGKIAGYSCHEPFDVLFSRSEFEYGDLVEVSGLEPPTSTLRTCLWRTLADCGELSRQVSELSTRRRTTANGGVRGISAG